MSEGDSDFRRIDRPPQSKPFAIDDTSLQGASMNELYDSYPQYKEIKNLYNSCLLYANAYSSTLLKRLEAERPDFFEEAGMSKEALATHYSHNICLPYTKLKGKVFRDTTVKIKEKQHLQD